MKLGALIACVGIHDDVLPTMEQILRDIHHVLLESN